MTFWSGERLTANPQVVSDFDPGRVDANAYNLSMGSSYFRTRDKEAEDEPTRVTLSPGAQFAIPPGQFAFLLTKEVVRVPSNAMALISMRTRIKLQGLINVSGFHIDPGYEGHIIYAVF